METWLNRFSVFINSYTELFFIHSRLSGGLLLLVTMLNPNVGIAGLFSVISAYLFSRLIGMEKSFVESGFFTYNALLVGLSVGYLFSLGGLSLYLVAAAGVLSFVLSIMLNSIFSYYLKLPILSLPFVIVSTVTWLASQGYGGLYVSGPYAHGTDLLLTLPPWLEGFFISLGAILFTPQPLAGAVIALVIFWHSRILFLLAAMGYYLGAVLSAMLGGEWQAIFADINHFNYILIAMTLGGVYLVPSPRGYLIAAIGVAVGTLLLSAVRLFWANYGIPVFTLPFNLVTLAFLYMLGIIGFPLVAKNVRATPEQTLDDYLSTSLRFGAEGRIISLPFTGRWCVWQGFDGEWTHQGSLRHAYDFVIARSGKTHEGIGEQLSHYFAWRKPVLAPCRGRVVCVVANHPDNPPGHVDSQNNWGNLVIIESDAGGWVELSHFAQHSVSVQEGQWVEVGTQLGLCGNSGYSSQPHIHIQVQMSAAIGAPTQPFCFAGYLEEGCFVSHGRPDTGIDVEPLFADRGLEFRTAFPLETTLHYWAVEEGSPPQQLDIRVCMSELGESYFDSGQGKLFFARDLHSFYFYRLEGNDPGLALLFSAVPRMPLSYRHDMQWQDAPPLAAVVGGWQRHFIDLLRAVRHQVGRSHYQARWCSGGLIQGVLRRVGSSAEELVEVELHPRLGFSKLRVGEKRLILEEVAPCAS